MEADNAKNLGPPDIKLEGLQIWIHGRQYPKAEEYWDANWLRVTAHCGRSGASVWTTGSIIHLSEILHWQTGSKALRDTLTGEATLPCMEPELSVSLKAMSLGHIAMEVSITPDNMSQRHWFKFEIDQSYLDPLLEQFKKILDAYPVKGQP